MLFLKTYHSNFTILKRISMPTLSRGGGDLWEFLGPVYLTSLSGPVMKSRHFMSEKTNLTWAKCQNSVIILQEC